MTVLDSLAAELGVNGRSLRRAAERGMIRVQRPSPRRTELSFGERRYVETHWGLLSALVSWLRTRPNVRLAVVYGSVARGDDGPESDVDILVSLARENAHTTASLAASLGEELGRRAQVVSLDAAERAPLLLLDVVREGRALVDRDDEWPVLIRRERQLEREAAAAEDELDRRVAELAELVAADAG
jgi:predicted nucleotidyltransferase